MVEKSPEIIIRFPDSKTAFQGLKVATDFLWLTSNNRPYEVEISLDLAEPPRMSISAAGKEYLEALRAALQTEEINHTLEFYLYACCQMA